jgi:phosphotransferase system  glucose/maltose/N-acetylglucosamine-specific IIC component
MGGTENLRGEPGVQARDRFRRHFTYGRLEAASIIHSVIFAALMVSAFLLGKPEPATFVFGFLHGVLFIAMAVVCAFAGVYEVLPPKVVVAVIVFGGAGPFIGSLWFVRYADERPRPG